MPATCTLTLGALVCPYSSIHTHAVTYWNTLVIDGNTSSLLIFPAAPGVPSLKLAYSCPLFCTLILEAWGRGWGCLVLLACSSPVTACAPKCSLRSREMMSTYLGSTCWCTPLVHSPRGYSPGTPYGYSPLTYPAPACALWHAHDHLHTLGPHSNSPTELLSVLGG